MPVLDDVARRALDWPVEHIAVAVVSAEGAVAATAGDVEREFPLASVTKILTAYAVLAAVDGELLSWDTPAGPEGSTVRHLAAHASGLSFHDATWVQAAPGTRRIYSNAGFEVLGETVAAASGQPFTAYLDAAVLQPLGMAASRLDGSPGAGAVSTVADLCRLAAELQSPTLISARLLAEATEVAYPGLAGVLPGYGRQQPNDWGLGWEIRGSKDPHWTGATSSPETFGHFGRSGTFLWVDPEAGLACLALTDRDFGDWAIQAWPAFTDQVLAQR
ncbi:MAG: beta-lactamase family protein [Geodermatophilaceae bacterium]|nr:beta-lactamase family protein [Geodermatophilaceae bacterium]